MNSELLGMLECIEQDRGIAREEIIEVIETSLMSASKKSMIHPASQIEIKIDSKTGDIKAIAKLEVVDTIPTSDQIVIDRVKEKIPDVKLGDVVDWEVTPRNFGRIAAQNARQAIKQQLQNYEQDILKKEFESQIGEIVNGTVSHLGRGGIVVDFGKTEGFIAARDRIYKEQYTAGERINALLVKINANQKGPTLVLSRVSDDFVKKLFEREVSEITDEIVEIVSIARDPGYRTKISVKSSDDNVDPVGACVGLRGMRIRNINTELGGERIDIVPYSDDIKEYVASSLEPAKVEKVEVEEITKTLTVYVSSEQVKLAFGRKAQNIKLAKKLLNWRINIIEEKEEVEESFESKKEKMILQLADSLKLEKEIAEKLAEGGYLSLEGLKEVSEDDLNGIESLDEDEVKSILEALSEL